MNLHPQLIASDPRRSAFVAANAGSGKTKTLVERVARLLLHGAPPEAILCVTYTKAAAAEMQRRLFEKLGAWSVLPDAALARQLEELDETARDLGAARTLFAKALETPGGLKIQTIHAFCEKVLRRFPLEAGVSPGFTVMDDVAAAGVSRAARDAIGRAVFNDPAGALAAAYRHFCLACDLSAFEDLLTSFETERGAIIGYLEAVGGLPGAERDLAARLGLETPLPDPEELEARACSGCEPEAMRAAAAALEATGAPSDAALAVQLRTLAAAGGRPFADLLELFLTTQGERRKRLCTKGASEAARRFLEAEMERCLGAADVVRAARAARETLHALRLAAAYALAYEAEKSRRGVLDFPDLVAKTRRLMTEAEDAAWVLYKLDGGLDHILLDEAQDTSPEQWEILEALTSDFFSGDGSRRAMRTVFAVGDEKQSIFSFQGADPDQLRLQTQAYGARAAGVAHAFDLVPLTESWRSAPEVLEFVDHVFAGLPEPGSAVRHEAVRPRGQGSVELWPLFTETPSEEPDAWDAPLDAASREGARKRLARRIAREIVAITAASAVVAKGDPRRPVLRPARPGDVLILVRRRDALFEEIIRALKAEGVPAAGADRLRLSDHVVFQDVLSLFRFSLYPDDDLTLAELLRSPFCDLGEEELYALAQGRSASLWAALQARSGERSAFSDAEAFLSWARREGLRRTPFDFLNSVLGRMDPSGRSMRQRILTRLGAGAEDALEELQGRALTAEGRGVRDLEGLTAELERAEIQVKRELDDDDGGFVRVMTVHGAKGLEAPIVILADTTGVPKPRGGARLGRLDDGGFLLLGRTRDDCPRSADARGLLERKTSEEQLRLLYVALTRARDRLIIAGRTAATRGPAKGSWYALVEGAFEAASGVRRVVSGDLEVRRIGGDPPPARPAAAAPAPGRPAAPAWLAAPAPRSASALKLTPSGRREGGQAPSPLARTFGLGRFRRGLLIHRLLEILPDLAPTLRPEGARRLLLKEADLDEEQRREIASAALRVLEDERFAEVFGPGSRAEAAIAGSAPGLERFGPVAGRVDRLLVARDRVLVVDFKSNRPAPDRLEDVDRAYLEQMAIYVAVLKGVFPGRRIEAALVWTDGPKLTVLPPELIDTVLTALTADR